MDIKQKAEQLARDAMELSDEASKDGLNTAYAYPEAARIKLIEAAEHIEDAVSALIWVQ